MIDKIARLLRANPFRPFSVSTTSGETFVVPHPDHALVSPKGSLVTIYGDDDTAVWLWALHITAIKTTEDSNQVTDSPGNA
jgi:hypothetical protein